MPSMRTQRGSQAAPERVFTSSGNPSSRRIVASLRMMISAGRTSSSSSATSIPSRFSIARVCVCRTSVSPNWSTTTPGRSSDSDQTSANRASARR